MEINESALRNLLISVESVAATISEILACDAKRESPVEITGEKPLSDMASRVLEVVARHPQGRTAKEIVLQMEMEGSYTMIGSVFGNISTLKSRGLIVSVGGKWFPVVTQENAPSVSPELGTSLKLHNVSNMILQILGRPGNEKGLTAYQLRTELEAIAGWGGTNLGQPLGRMRQHGLIQQDISKRWSLTSGKPKARTLHVTTPAKKSSPKWNAKMIWESLP